MKRAIAILLLISFWALNGFTAEPLPRILVFSKTLLYRHLSIPAGIAAIQKLGTENHFDVDATEDSAVFTKTNLQKYAAIVFLSTTGDVLDGDQQTAFREYVENGGGFAAVHGAIAGREATEGSWPWYHDLLGTDFVNHTPVVPGIIMVEDTNNPSTAGLPLRWPHSEEWYYFSSNPRGTVHVLATVDESSYWRGPVKDHPISWCKDAGKGRMWFTALGHTDECFSEPLFLKHLLGGIQYVMAKRT